VSPCGTDGRTGKNRIAAYYDGRTIRQNILPAFVRVLHVTTIIEEETDFCFGEILHKSIAGCRSSTLLDVHERTEDSRTSEH